MFRTGCGKGFRGRPMFRTGRVKGVLGCPTGRVAGVYGAVAISAQYADFLSFLSSVLVSGFLSSGPGFVPGLTQSVLAEFGTVPSSHFLQVPSAILTYPGLMSLHWSLSLIRFVVFLHNLCILPQIFAFDYGHRDDGLFWIRDKDFFGPASTHFNSIYLVRADMERRRVG